MAKKTVYAIRQTRYLGERAMPGEKFVVDESEMPGLISSGRFSEDPDDIPEQEEEGAPAPVDPKKPEVPAK